MSEPAPEVPEREPDDGFSGFVVIALTEVPEVVAQDDLLAVAAATDLRRVASVLRDVTDLRTAMVIPREQRETVARLEETARRNNPQRPRHSLLLFWRIDARSGPLAPEVLAAALAVQPGVHTAYPEVRVADRRVSSSATARLAFTHADPRPHGVDIAAARMHSGGLGTGVRFVDVEEAWRLTHPMLVAPAKPYVLKDAHRVNRDSIGFPGDHGTAALAIVLGNDTGQGAVGLTSELELAAASSTYSDVDRSSWYTQPAIVAATDELTAGTRKGGILLLELERGPEGHQLPTEIDYADFQAITTAVDNHVVVVEAAGNGERNLDAWKDFKTARRMERDVCGSDSGAIVVGACVAVPVGDGHTRITQSNWGARVDCYAWGEAVHTAAAVDYADFAGTSAASAIIAGVAAAVQGIVIARNGIDAPLGSTEMRKLLSDPAHGTPQVEPGRAKRIGSMPDLALIAPIVAGP